MSEQQLLPSTERRNISNSEVTSFLSCTQQYDFAFMRNLTPKVTPTPLARGTLGHLAFQYYIEARLNGDIHELAMKATDRAFDEAIKNNTSVDIVLETKYLVERYMAHKVGWPKWKLLGTEQHLELQVTDNIWMPMRYDLLVEERDSGRLLIGDFKFTYDFWSHTEHSLNGQTPKYISIMRANGIDVAGGFLEEIRTRKLGKEKSSDHRNLWKTTHYYPSKAKCRNLLKQHIAASLKIMEYRNLPEGEREAETIPVLAKHGACRYCDFTELCASKLDGKDITLDIELDFVENTYGYNKNDPATVPLGEML